jgi:hypothetical protein
MSDRRRKKPFSPPYYRPIETIQEVLAKCEKYRDRPYAGTNSLFTRLGHIGGG